MLLRFWHEVVPALDGMAGTLGCTQLCWVRSEEVWLHIRIAVTCARVLCILCCSGSGFMSSPSQGRVSPQPKRSKIKVPGVLGTCLSGREFLPNVTYGPSAEEDDEGKVPG